jgi:hypothetical protein
MTKLRAIARHHHHLGSRDGLREDDDYDYLVFRMIYVVRFSIFTAHIGRIDHMLLSETLTIFAFALNLGRFAVSVHVRGLCSITCCAATGRLSNH